MMALRISRLGIWGFRGLGIQWFQGERSNVKVYNVGEPIPIRLFEVLPCQGQFLDLCVTVVCRLQLAMGLRQVGD